MVDRVHKALARSADIAAAPLDTRATTSDAARPRSRVFAMGDPQATSERLFRILDAHGILGDEGMLADDAALVSIGDHFDFGTGDRTAAGREGLRNLRWLAAHPRDQVVILAGNHDLSRLMELGLETDASFGAAHTLATRIRDAEAAGEDAAPLEAIFAATFPNIATPGLAYRDYASFTEAQQQTVAALVTSGRLALGHASRLSSGEPVLLTHAAVTARELEILGLGLDARADAIQSALNAYLRRAAGSLHEIWARGERARLDLGPLHVAGASGVEGGGLLYHRPANPSRSGADRSWEFDARAPRRFDPRTLPPDLVQICGHSAHRKTRRELGAWVSASAQHDEPCLRTLSARGDSVRYEARVDPPRAGEATLYLIDAEMNISDPASYPLFRLGALTA